MKAPVLTVPRSAAGLLPEKGVWPFAEDFDRLPTAWIPRDQAETDERYLQIIPYALLQDSGGNLWCYERLGGDERLRRRLSCGLGGHVEPLDDADGLLATAVRALARELAEELANPPAFDGARPQALLYEGLSAIGRVHLGLVYRLDWVGVDPPRIARGEALESVGFRPAVEIAADPAFELWSRLAAGWASRTG